ncbi:MAG: dienelactone hydrolase family protein [Pelovirga sp.]
MKRLLVALLCITLFASSGFASGTAVDYRIDGVTYEGYFISPSPAAPFILLIHDWDGLGQYEIQRSQMLADQGYAVFAADMFGKGVRPAQIEDRRRLTSALYQDREMMRKLLQGALDAAAQQGANIDNAVAIGYCFGGAVILELARAGAPLKGFVSFHGGLTTPEGQSYAETNGSVLILHGTADTAVSMDEFAQLAKELEEQKVVHEMITYSGAPHAFTVFGSDRYREDADRKSWQRFLDYLKETLQ